MLYLFDECRYRIRIRAIRVNPAASEPGQLRRCAPNILSRGIRLSAMSGNRRCMDPKKTAVFEQTLIQRINRKLNSDAKQLRTARTFQMETSVGHYFIVDLRRDSINRKQIDLEEVGREMGVLADSEVVIFASTRAALEYCYNPVQMMVREDTVREKTRCFPSRT